MRCPNCGHFRAYGIHLDVVSANDLPEIGNPNIVTVICPDCDTHEKCHLGPILSNGWMEMKLLRPGRKDFYGIGI